MKKTILLLASLFVMTAINAEKITTGELFNLFFKAQKAEKNNENEEALSMYKTILSIDSGLPTPYLKMANIYAKNENDPASIEAAIILYNKYLNMQFDNEDAPAIKNRVAQLQKFVINGQGTNLADIIYINQGEAQDIINTTARRRKFATKEKMVEMVEKENALYDRVQESISNNNFQTGTASAEQLLVEVDPANPLAAQASMMLADMYRRQGDMQKMRGALTTLEENLETYKQMQQFYNTTLKDALPFEDDICGIWVSDLAYNDATPFLAVEIAKEGRATHKYTATILPYCTLAERHKMYSGKPFNYEAKYSANTERYFANSLVDSVHLNNNKAYFYFGDRKFRGTSKEVDDHLIKPTNELIGGVVRDGVSPIYNDPNATTEEKMIAAAIETIGAFIQWGVGMLTIKKTTEIGLELNMQRLFAGCADINMVHTTFVTKTNGDEKETADSMQMRLYKLYSEDNILFAANGNELFGYRTFNKDETLQTEEYEHLQELKSKNYFNKQAYKKLSEKISDFCFSKAAEDEYFSDLAYDCRMRFEYASKGLSYRILKKHNGTFEGWIDLSGKMNGVGKCMLNDGTSYIGSWENNKYSGEGKITFRDKTTYDVVQEYTGTFKNNKYHGRGLLYREDISYDGGFVNGAFHGMGTIIDANGNEYSGSWKNDKPVKGTITYANGDRYEGQSSYNKKTRQLERNGQGAMVYLNGEMASGKWKNNELTIKK